MGFIKLLVMVSGAALSYLYLRNKSKKSKVTLEFTNKEEESNDSSNKISNTSSCSGNCNCCHSCKTEESKPVIEVTDIENEEEIIEVKNIIVDYSDDKEDEENILEQMMREEEEAEDCYGYCIGCSNFKKEDEEYVLGYCTFHDREMLQDDGCFDFDSLR